MNDDHFTLTKYFLERNPPIPPRKLILSGPRIPHASPPHVVYISVRTVGNLINIVYTQVYSTDSISSG